jgi:hypothetical protein
MLQLAISGELVPSQAMAKKDGVESDFTCPDPSKYAGKTVVVRIKHSPPEQIQPRQSQD